MSTAVLAAPDTVRLAGITIRHFRNLERTELEVPEAGMALIGENGQGKTNVLEAIYYVQLLRSMRGARDQDVVQLGSPSFHIAADVAGDAVTHTSIGFERASKRKRVSVGGCVVPRLSDALGGMPAVVVSPSDMALVAGGPSERRRFLDVMLALTSRRYLHALQQYRAALARRNAALRDAARRSTRRDDASVAVWEPAMAEHGALLWQERVAWMARAASRFSELCEAIGERGAARARYVHSVAPADDMAAALLAAFDAQRATDFRRGMTHAGPHRDDIEMTLDHRELRVFGSGGQQRTAAIALRLLEADTLRERYGREPMYLLDDPFAELDARRAHRILELLGVSGWGQTILAVPRASDVPRELTRLTPFHIDAGVVVAAA